jgi:hypothetical protein
MSHEPKARQTTQLTHSLNAQSHHLYLLPKKSSLTMLASSLLMRRSAVSMASKKSMAAAPTSLNGFAMDTIARRFKSDDVGDVIGIDLGTTNSCVAIMVRTIEY